MIINKLNFYIIDKIYKKLHRLYINDIHHELKNKISLILPHNEINLISNNDETKNFIVYCRNWNVLNMMNGIGGLSYNN